MEALKAAISYALSAASTFPQRHFWEVKEVTNYCWPSPRYPRSLTRAFCWLWTEHAHTWRRL